LEEKEEKGGVTDRDKDKDKRMGDR